MGNNDYHDAQPKTMKLIYGIFMILFYIAVGLLCIFQVFSIFDTAISCTVGGILCAYAVFRAYRLYINMKSNG